MALSTWIVLGAAYVELDLFILGHHVLLTKCAARYN